MDHRYQSMGFASGRTRRSRRPYRLAPAPGKAGSSALLIRCWRKWSNIYEDPLATNFLTFNSTKYLSTYNCIDCSTKFWGYLSFWLKWSHQLWCRISSHWSMWMWSGMHYLGWCRQKVAMEWSFHHQQIQLWNYVPGRGSTLNFWSELGPVTPAGCSM